MPLLGAIQTISFHKHFYSSFEVIYSVSRISRWHWLPKVAHMSHSLKLGIH